MTKWVGKTKDKNTLAIHQASNEKQGNLLYKMTLSLVDNIYTRRNRETKNYLKDEIIYNQG
ncbi:hypothetical protein FQP34_18595 [Peribacillus simplex]|uniref:Uncharacterized protein n=1 Tax=Peribacillus simplex TaxID=1478 RepID=A0A8B5XV74_9BACI|nr:hypothetical protein [Peribacillus simplex]TVX78558.1 hypothetical protein FQP34_18595 [Peribacillus simplex]